MGKNEFSNKIKLKCLQCCDRHCCLCDKQCSTNIEIHHIVPIEQEKDNSFDNAIPLCLNCHSKVQSYNNEHPIGNKYRYEELKNRRNQVYDKHTSPFLPNIKFEIISLDPKVYNLARLSILNIHQYLTCKIRTIFSVYHNKKLLKRFDEGLYGGKTLWSLNPNSGGNFPPNFLILDNMPKKVESLQVEIKASIIDKFEWEHDLLPVSWFWGKNTGWYFQPTSVEDS